MRILHINTFSVNSTGKIVQKYIKEQQKEHDCFFAFSRGPKIENITCIRIGNKLDFLMHVLLTRLFDLSGRCSHLSTYFFIKKIKKLNPDIIYLHNLHGYYLNYKILFRFFAKSKAKFFWTLHDCWPYTGHCAYYSKIKCNKWKNGCFDCQLKREYPASWVLDYSSKNYLLKKRYFNLLNVQNTEIIVPSKWLLKEVKDSFLNKYKIFVKNNEIDETVFYHRSSDFRKKYNLEDKRLLLSVASSWEKRKGLDILINLSKYLDEDFVLVIVGLEDKVIRKIKMKNVLLLPRTRTQIELSEIYSACDAYFSASVEETFGMTFLEAYSCGCRKIYGFDCCAIPEILEIVGGEVIEFNTFSPSDFCKKLSIQVPKNG